MQTHNSQTLSRKQLLRDRATFMRHHPASSEALLFSVLRGKRLGASFKRQVVSGSHIVDLLARKARLVVEVDGDVLHEHSRSRDAARDRKLVRAGYTVLRIPASLIERDLAGATALVQQALVEQALQ